MFDFIEEAFENLESVLIHSASGYNRSASLLIPYLMMKYDWTLKKSLQLVMGYVNLKK